MTSPILMRSNLKRVWPDYGTILASMPQTFNSIYGKIPTLLVGEESITQAQERYSRCNAALTIWHF